MKSIRIAIIALLVLLAGCVRDDEPDVRSLGKGDPLPVFAVQTLDGEMVTSSQLEGKVSLICFFNTSCGDCRKELPVLQKLYESPEGSDINFLCISREEGEESVRSYWEANGLTLPVSAQPTAAIYHLFANYYIPRIYVVDKAGIIRAVFVEGGSYADILAALRHALLNC